MYLVIRFGEIIVKIRAKGQANSFLSLCPPYPPVPIGFSRGTYKKKLQNSLGLQVQGKSSNSKTQGCHFG